MTTVHSVAHIYVHTYSLITFEVSIVCTDYIQTDIYEHMYVGLGLGLGLVYIYIYTCICM